MACFVLLVGLCFLSACASKKDISPYKSSRVSRTYKGYAITETASTQMGKKYVYGGESPHKGFDCSGLIWWTYKQHGIDIPRVTTGQAQAGRSVQPRQARPGDIIVFRMSKNALHTGIYAGKSKFIHSPRTGERIRLENISDYWKKRLVGVRRILN